MGSADHVFKTGKVGVTRETFKHDTFETPSVAFCPFFANTTVVMPKDTARMVTAEMFTPSGGRMLKPNIKTCKFDRTCVCADMHEYRLTDHTHRDAGHLGYGAGESERATEFREKVAFETTLVDPSPDKVFKVGLYTEFDEVPSWAYARQGAYTMMSLEVELFYVTDMSHYSIWEFLKGDVHAFVRPRQMFNINSQQVGGESLGPNITSQVVYQLRTYYIEEAVVSESAVSLYTLGFLALWILGQRALTGLFIEALMPAKAEDPDRVQGDTPDLRLDLATKSARRRPAGAFTPSPLHGGAASRPGPAQASLVVAEEEEE
ncbi:unnamed protein product, partial [Prorocentrum cordatum]